jgi:orotate phosphoribosyltransferase
MTQPGETDAAAFLRLVAGRRGHFRMESGLHSGLWLDLDPLFIKPRRIAPFVTAFVARLRPYDVDAVCGPMLGGAFLAQLAAHALGIEFYFTERVQTGDGRDLFQARYRLPSAVAARVRGKRVALVDDVMSAGPSLRATDAELRAHGAEPVVAGALLILGTIGADYFAGRGIAVEAAAREDFAMWPTDACPLCAAGVPLEDVASLVA